MKQTMVSFLLAKTKVVVAETTYNDLRLKLTLDSFLLGVNIPDVHLICRKEEINAVQ